MSSDETHPDEAPDGEPPPDDVAAGEPPAEESGDISAVRREAATHRRKLRETEAERDALAARLEHAHRSEIERIASAPAQDFRPLQLGEDLWRADGIEIAGLLDEEGNVDADRVRSTVGEITAGRPHWLARIFADSDAGKGHPPPVDDEPSFGAGLKGAQR